MTKQPETENHTAPSAQSRLFPKHAAIAAAILVVLATFFWSLWVDATGAWITLRLRVDQPAVLEVACRPEKGDSMNRVKTHVEPRVVQYVIRVGSIRRTGRVALTFRTPERVALEVTHMKVTSAGRTPWELTGSRLAQSSTGDQATVVTPSSNGITVSESSGKARVRIEYELPKEHSRVAAAALIPRALPMAVIRAGAILLVLALARSVQQAAAIKGVKGVIAAGLSAAALLALVMAVSSRFNAHPDEMWHTSAAGYYMTNLTPPGNFDPLALPTFSSFRHTYLSGLEVVYVAAGKWLATFQPIVREHMSLPVLTRMFQVACFVLLVGYLLARGAHGMALVLLCSAQVWYVFSYFNSDAFAFATATILAFVCASPKSRFRQSLLARTNPAVMSALFVATTSTALMFSKKNYWIILIFCGALIALDLISGLTRPGNATRRAPLITITVLLTTTGLGWGMLSHFRAHRTPDPPVPTTESRPKIALSDKAKQKIDSVSFLRSKGESLEQLVKNRHWAWLSFSSMFGVFGWHTVRAVDGIYLVQIAAFALLLGWLVYRGVLRRTWDSVVVTCAAVVCVAASIGLSLWWCWTVSFQPQGRYLLPIFILAGGLWERLDLGSTHRFPRVLVALLFILSALVFVFAGIQFIDSVPIDDNL